MRTLLAGLAATAALLGCVVTSATADAAAVTDVGMFSDSGDYVGGGQSQVFMPPHDTVSVSGNPSDVTVTVDSPGGYNFEFAAPQGQRLQPGVYDGATRAAFRSGSAPGIDIWGDGRGCNTTTGRFEVKDVHVGSAGVPDRMWIVYEMHCEGAGPALFGEVRIGEPAGGGAVTPEPALLRWPEEDPGRAQSVVPVEFVAAAGTTLSAASLGGADPGEFAIREDDCGGRALIAGTKCEVFVRFTPTSPGTMSATLTVTDTAGVAYTVPLEGWSDGGTTRFSATSDSGDWIGGGASYDLTPSNATFAAGGTRAFLSFSAGGFNGSFHPGPNDILTTGATYDGAQRDAFRDNAPGMEVDSPGRGCNTVTGTFTVVSASFLPDGAMHSIDLTFTQHCDGVTPALHGELKWKDGDTTTPAPWMSPDGYPISPGSPAGAGGDTGSSATSGPSSGSGASGGTGSSSSASGTPATAPGSPSTPLAATTSTAPSSSTAPQPSSSTFVTRAATQPTTIPSAKAGVTRARLHQLLVGLVRADRTFQAAVAVLARGSRETRQRQRAEAAATDLERAVTAVRIALRRSPSVLARGETRRVVSALASLESLLAAERQALSRPRTKGIATAARIERRRSAVERRALRVLSTAR